MVNENKNNNLSEKNSEEITQKDAAVSTESSSKLEDVQASPRSTENQTGYLPLSMRDFISSFKTYILCSEDDIGLQIPSTKSFEFKDKEPMFVIVDSSCISNPSSQELLIENRKGTVLTKHFNKNVIPIGIPSTSRDIREHIQPQLEMSESTDELLMIDINLQSDNEIPVDYDETDNESIVLSYLHKKDMLLDMEELSETSLDARIPSYPGSPRSLSYGPGNSLVSYDAEDHNHDTDSRLRQAVDYLQEDNDFLEAAEMGDVKLLEELISKETNIQQLDYFGRNALHLAVCSGSESTMVLLLEAGVNPNVKDNVGMTPLSLCLMRSPSMRVANLLFDHGARILPRSNPMDTGLFLQFVMMCIPTLQEEEILHLLLEKGAFVNDPDAPGGRQALHFAAMSNNCDLINILVSLGANLYETNHRGETPREFAMTFKCREAISLLEELEVFSSPSTISSAAISMALD